MNLSVFPMFASTTIVWLSIFQLSIFLLSGMKIYIMILKNIPSKFLKVPIDLAALDYTTAHNNFPEIQSRYLEAKEEKFAKDRINRPNSLDDSSRTYR